MNEILFTLSEKLYNKLLQIKTDLTKKENYNVELNDLIEEALMSYFKISILDINKKNEDIPDENILNNINISKHIKEYYVYCYCDLNKKIDKYVNDFFFEYEPFYIGKGFGYRIYDLNNRDSNLIDHINELKKIDSLKITKIIDNLSEKDAYFYEQILINNFGKINNGTGVLYNKANGNGLHNKEVDSSNYKLNLEYNLIRNILKLLNNEKKYDVVAKKLNMSERTLYRKIKKYSIVRDKKSKTWNIQSL